MQVMVDELSGIDQSETIEVKLDQINAEMLLFDFLNELIFYKDAKRLLLLPTRLSIAKSGDGWRLQGTLEGEEIDPGKHKLDTDVKAVTMLRFSLTQGQEGWRATVVLDV
jgi:SHS2 domain-containing protein